MELASQLYSGHRREAGKTEHERTLAKAEARHYLGSEAQRGGNRPPSVERNGLHEHKPPPKNCTREPGARAAGREQQLASITYSGQAARGADAWTQKATRQSSGGQQHHAAQKPSLGSKSPIS